MTSPAKIIATIGPASDKPVILSAMIQAGLSVARLNFSHGAYEWHARIFQRIRRLAKEEGRHIAILQDLCGPKVRIGPMKNCVATLDPGQLFTITTRKVPGDEVCVNTAYKALPRLLRKGDRLYLADGLLELQVERIHDADVHCVVVRGGELGSYKGITLPSGRLPLSAVTRRDIEDLRFGMGLGFDYVALSYVGSAKDIQKVKSLLQENTPSKQAIPGVIAKIERPEALANLDEILHASDGVMIARGDLGVEIPPERVPMEQKRIIQAAACANIPVITATQMLESMTQFPIPTRAEVSDVANAILDGTDAVMLSAETATGRYPVEAVKIMTRIGESVADFLAQKEPGGGCCGGCSSGGHPEFSEQNEEALSTCQAAIEAACASNAMALCAFTQTGRTALSLSKFLPPMPILALSPQESTLRKCALYRGVMAIPAREVTSIDGIPREVERLLNRYGLASPGATVVIVFGAPLMAIGRTNMIKVHRIGSVS